MDKESRALWMCSGDAQQTLSTVDVLLYVRKSLLRHLKMLLCCELREGAKKIK